MFDFSKRFGRRVSISGEDGALTITIRRRNDFPAHIANLLQPISQIGLYQGTTLL
jgi:hypothetical protein